MKKKQKNISTLFKDLLLIGLAVLLFTNFYVFANELRFKDVKKSDWFYDDIVTAVDLGIVKGYEDETFRPNNNILLSESLKVALDVSNTKYEVIKGSKWYYDIERVAKEKNLYTGSTKINEEVTRNDVAEIIFNTLGGTEEKSNIKFADEIDGKIGYLVNRNIINGYNENNKFYFKGDNKITRAEFFSLMTRVSVMNSINRNANKTFTEIYLKDRIKFNENIKSYDDITENIFYKILNDEDIFTAKANDDLDFTEFKRMSFDAHQLLNDQYPEYFSYYYMTTVGEKYIGNKKYYYVNLRIPSGERYDNKSHIQRRKESFRKLDEAIDFLHKENRINPNYTDYKNARAIYDYLLDNISYFDDEFTDKDPIDFDTYDVYGFTHRNEGVCQAYVGTLNYMYRKVGIESKGIAGTDIYDDTPHVWVKAEIDGKDVYIDPTFGGESNNRDKYFDMDLDFYENTYIEKKYSYKKEKTNF